MWTGLGAIVFAFCHGTLLQLFGTTVFGIITGWLYWRTKSLLPGIRPEGSPGRTPGRCLLPLLPAFPAKMVE